MRRERTLPASQPAVPPATGLVSLWPGAVQPILGYAAMAAAVIGALVLAVVAPLGGHRPFPPAGDWGALPTRAGVAEIMVVMAWGFYKLASNRIVLRAESMEIVGVLLRWVVARDEVADVVLTPRAMAVVLADGCVIRPLMFRSSGLGAMSFQAGLFPNAMSRRSIRERILQWRTPVVVGSRRGRGRGVWPCRRHWRLRLDLAVLAPLAGVIAIEAILVTAFA